MLDSRSWHLIGYLTNIDLKHLLNVRLAVPELDLYPSPAPEPHCKSVDSNMQKVEMKPNPKP